MTEPAATRGPAFWLTRLTLALIMAWPLLIIDRGFDLIDSGYYLNNYRYAFIWPEVNSLTMILSNWLGGLIYALLPETGLFLAYKVICVAINALITWLSFLIVREHFPPWLNLLALTLANAFPLALIYIASYNSFSYLFLSAAILLLYRGLERDKPLFLYLAAVLLGLNPFVRLPNILQWGLVAVPFWHYWFCLNQRGRAMSVGLRFILTILLTWLAFLGLCWLVQGPAWLEREAGALITLLFKSQDYHSAFTMWDNYDLFIRDGAGLFRRALFLCGPLALALAAGLVILRRRWGAAPFLAAVGLAAGPALIIIDGRFYEAFASRGPAYLPGMCLILLGAGPVIALAGLLWYHQRRPLLSSLSAMVIVILLAMPLGSDFWVSHYLYYTHLSLAVMLGLAWRLWLDLAVWLETKRPGWEFRDLGPALVCANVLFWFLLVFSLRALDDDQMLKTHHDTIIGAATAEVPGIPTLAGMNTHPARAIWLGELAVKLAQYGDLPLVVMGNCPLCYFFSESPPLLPNPWLDLASQSPHSLNQGLARAAEEGRLPAVLMVSSVNSVFDLWVLNLPNYSNENIVKLFMETHRYTLAADQLAYKLYLPPGREMKPPAVFPGTVKIRPRL